MTRGEVRRLTRKRWLAEGRCRDCGAPLDKPGESNKCAGCRGSWQERKNVRRREARDTASGVGLDVIVTLPAGIVRQAEVKAKERGETVAGWCRAEIIEIFNEEKTP